MRYLLCIIVLVLLMAGCKPESHIKNLNNRIVGNGWNMMPMILQQKNI